MQEISSCKTIVIKIGSSLIINETNIVRQKWMSEFTKEIKELLRGNKNVIIVSSGAIAIG